MEYHNPKNSPEKFTIVVALCLLPVVFAWLVGVALRNGSQMLFKKLTRK
jgi:hypothetical protein